MLAHADVKSPTDLRFDHGLYIQKSRQNTLLGVPTTNPLIAIGLGYLAPTGDKSVFNLGDHTKLADRRRLKMMTVSGAPYWLRSVHAGNDSKDPFAGYLDGLPRPGGAGLGHARAFSAYRHRVPGAGAGAGLEKRHQMILQLGAWLRRTALRCGSWSIAPRPLIAL